MIHESNRTPFEEIIRAPLEEFSYQERREIPREIPPLQQITPRPGRIANDSYTSYFEVLRRIMLEPLIQERLMERINPQDIARIEDPCFSRNPTLDASTNYSPIQPPATPPDPNIPNR
jgi:hypothetical protein